jgi:pyruvate dehydrogenase E2 component (dihydrolipoamide acetyltransferase)
VARQTASQSNSSQEKKESDAPKKESPPSSLQLEPSKPLHNQESKRELEAGQRIFASPIAKKIALEKGIPLAKIQGTGPLGRIIREDVEKYKPSSPTSASATATTVQLPAAALQVDYVDTPVSNMRRTIGSRLTQSKQEIPHYYLTVDIDMGKVLKLREVFNKTLSEKDLKLSVNDFVVKAVACALADVPEANSAWLGEVIRTYVLPASVHIFGIS